MMRSRQITKVLPPLADPNPAVGGALSFLSGFNIGMNYQDISTVASDASAFDTVLGKPIGGVHAFIGGDQMTWDQVLADADTKIAAISAAGRNVLMWDVHLTLFVPGSNKTQVDTSLAQIAAGVRDNYFTQIADKIVASMLNLPGRRNFTRLAWEMFDPSHPWYALGQESDFIAGVQHVISLFTARHPGKFEFVICPLLGNGDLNSIWPGNGYFSTIAPDMYLITQQTTVDIFNNFVYRYRRAGTIDVETCIAFAAAHGLKFGIAEFGVDNVLAGPYVANVAKICAEAGVPTVVILHWDKDYGPSDPKFYDRISAAAAYPKPKVVIEVNKQFGAISIVSPSAYKASQAHTTYLPLMVSKFSQTLLWEFVGAVPTGFSITGQTLVVAATAALGANNVTVKVTDAQGYTAQQTITVTVQTFSLTLFDPLAYHTISDLDFWFDTKTPSSFTFSGGRCSAMNDRSGNGHNRSMGVGTFTNQPIYSTTMRNGLPGFQYLPANFTRHEIASPGTLATGQSGRAYCGAFYVNAAALPGTNPTVIFGLTDTNVAVVNEMQSSDSRLRDRTVSNGDETSLFSTADNDMCFVSNKAAAASAGGRSILKQTSDGLTWHSGELPAPTLTPTRMVIGGRPTSNAVTLMTPMVEQEFYAVRRELTDFEVVLHQLYLAYRWAGDTRLPASYPGKGAAPRIIV